MEFLSIVTYLVEVIYKSKRHECFKPQTEEYRMLSARLQQESSTPLFVNK